MSWLHLENTGRNIETLLREENCRAVKPTKESLELEKLYKEYESGREILNNFGKSNKYSVIIPDKNEQKIYRAIPLKNRKILILFYTPKESGPLLQWQNESIEIYANSEMTTTEVNSAIQEFYSEYLSMCKGENLNTFKSFLKQ